MLREFGHQVEDVRDALPPGAADAQVAAFAKAKQFILVTRDFDFADIRNYPPEDYAGIIVLGLPDDAIVTQINQTLKSFVSEPELMARLTGRLAIVESWRARFRPHEPTN